jgi:hypothetical protein
MKTLAFLLLLCSPAWGQTKQGLGILTGRFYVAETRTNWADARPGRVVICFSGDTLSAIMPNGEKIPIAPQRPTVIRQIPEPPEQLFPLGVVVCGVLGGLSFGVVLGAICIICAVPTLEGFAQYLRRKQCGR